MDILWKSIVGGVVTGMIVWLSKRGSILPGIIPLFPTFALIALYIVGMKGDAGGFRQTCLAGIKTIPAYLVFLGACYFCIQKAGFRVALLSGLAVWFATALIVFLGPKYL
jgi:uncharacterized membrane protein (GlpM family)